MWFSVFSFSHSLFTTRVDSFAMKIQMHWRQLKAGQNNYTRMNSILNFISFYPLKQELDFGTILCWADNVVGQQKEPCVFHLIAAGKPDVPYNCTLVNQTSESLEVDCNEG
jgi:hypothetical protein